MKKIIIITLTLVMVFPLNASTKMKALKNLEFVELDKKQKRCQNSLDTLTASYNHVMAMHNDSTDITSIKSLKIAHKINCRNFKQAMILLVKQKCTLNDKTYKQHLKQVIPGMQSWCFGDVGQVIQSLKMSK